MKTACIFPGQGTQFVGMGKDLQSQELFKRASSVLGYDLKALCFEGPEDMINRTEFSQPAIVAVSYAKFLESNVIPDVVAGHSLGEYTAICAAGCISFEHAIRIVQKRGRYMASSDKGAGAMATVIGFNEEELKGLCRDAGVFIAAINDEKQIAVSGRKDRMRALKEVVEKSGKKFIPLSIGCAAHCALMLEAHDNMEKLLREIPFANPSVPVVSNASAVPYTSGETIKLLLTAQLVRPVQWERSVKTMLRMGVRNFFEAGPKQVLLKTVQRIQTKFENEQLMEM